MYNLKEYGPDGSDKVIFMFSGLGVQDWQLNLPGLPLWSFRRAGWKVRFYQYPWSLIDTADSYMGTLEAVYADAERHLRRVPKDARVVVFGLSWGSLAATRLAASHKRVEALILNVPYSDPVVHLFDFKPTRKIPVPAEYAKTFLGDGHTRSSFGKDIARYAPFHRAKDMGHLRVMLFLAHKDKFFLYKHTYKLRDALKAHAKEFVCLESQNFGHTIGGAKYSLRSARWLKWLDSPPKEPGRSDILDRHEEAV